MFQLLVVDDDKNIRRFLSTVLTNAGYKTFSTISAKEALHTMEQHKIDLIILDIMLSDMDGYAFAELLRGCGNDIPILMLSAKQQPRDIRQGFLSGTDDYMTKPVDEEEMTQPSAYTSTVSGTVLRIARISQSSQSGGSDIRHRLRRTHYKKKTGFPAKIVLLSTGIIFILLTLTMFISNAVIIFLLEHDIMDRPPHPGSLLPFLIQTGIISILIGTIRTRLLYLYG